MTIFAFVGPSLTAGDRSLYPNVQWRPPAEAGDLLRLRAASGDMVCLIDGYFDHRPAVRHKELLLLLSRGITVLGASSIGALRAAEMDRLGLLGTGVIYRAYATGRLCGDDEVALVHAPEEWGWKPLSLPLVDCRANLCRAVRSRLLKPTDARALLRAAKSIHYLERDWQSVLRLAQITQSTRSGVSGWIEAHGISQKRLDALACVIAASSEAFKKPPSPPMVWTSLARALALEAGITPEELS